MCDRGIVYKYDWLRGHRFRVPGVGFTALPDPDREAVKPRQLSTKQKSPYGRYGMENGVLRETPDATAVAGFF